jgi:hypothetical protein
MKFPDCPREPDLIEAVTTGQWPDRSNADLRTHVTICEGCRDLASILLHLGDAWDSTRSEVRLPASGLVWWRAQMRARQEAADAAARPIAVVQTVAAVAGGALALSCLVALAPWLTSFLEPWLGLLTIDVTGVPATESGKLLAGGVASLLVIATLAVYLVVAEE